MKQLLAVFFSLFFFANPVMAADMSTPKNAYDLSFTTIDGTDMPLSAYRGKVLLIVNTASRCGFTTQYEGLQKLYEAYTDDGLVIIGVPSNDFGGQEPGSAEDIKSFCETNYKITFPLTQKTVVSGDSADPFYKWAAEQKVGGFLGTVPRWNFHKYLIGRNGQLLNSFTSLTKPEDQSLRSAVMKALAEKN